MLTNKDKEEIKRIVLKTSIKISQLEETSTVNASDFINVIRSNNNTYQSRRITIENLLKAAREKYPSSDGAKLKGVARPNDEVFTPDRTTDTFWFAFEPGEYPAYGNMVVEKTPKIFIYRLNESSWEEEMLWDTSNDKIPFPFHQSTLVETEVVTDNIGVTPGNTYNVEMNVLATGTYDTFRIDEYSYDFQKLHSYEKRGNYFSVIPGEGTLYFTITVVENPSNPVDLDGSFAFIVAPTSSLVGDSYKYLSILSNILEDAFVEAEAARVEAEKQRVTADNSRTSAENARVNAETTRHTQFNADHLASVAAINAANTAAEAADEAREGIRDDIDNLDEKITELGQLFYQNEYILKNKAISYFGGEVPHITIDDTTSYDIFMVHIPVNMSIRKIKITGISSVNRCHFFDSAAFDNFTPEHWVSKYDNPNGVMIDIPSGVQICAFGVAHSNFPDGYGGIDVQITTSDDLEQIDEDITNLQEDVTGLKKDVKDLQLGSLPLYLASINGSTGEFEPVPSTYTSNTRAACKAYVKSPVTIEVNSGYQIYYLYRYKIAADGNISFVESVSIQQNMAVIKEDGYYYRFNFKKNDGTKITRPELEDIIKSVSAINTRLEDFDAGISQDYLLALRTFASPFAIEISCMPILEVGNVGITSSGWSYTESFVRVRTKEGVTIPLKKGDTIKLTDYTDAKMYIGWKRGNGTYGTSGEWKTEDFTVPEDGDYVIDLTNITPKSATISVLGGLLKIRVNSSDKKTDYVNGVLFGRPYYSHFLVAERNTIATNKIIAPSQSLFDIEVSARLGFGYIELNAQRTSDGKFVCFHGTSGKFDNQFELSNSPTGLFATTEDFTTIAVSQVTLSDIQASIRNRAKYEKYRTAPNTLEECLYACKKYGILPFVTFNAQTAPIIVSIMGKDDFIGYIGGASSITPAIRNLTNAVLFVFDDSSQSLNDAYKNADALGGAVMYDCTYADNAAESVTKEFVEEMHKKGYLVCGIPNYRNEAWNQKALRLGYDALCSGWNINPIKNGNICELYADIDYLDFTHNGSVSDGELILANGNTVSPNFQIPSVFIGGGYLEIKFNGTLTVVMGDKINLSVTSNNDDVHIFSSAFFESAPTFQLTSVGNTTIRGMLFKAARF